jgi:ABC-type nickel/cobalt efflux system permease component RcnA
MSSAADIAPAQTAPAVERDSRVLTGRMPDITAAQVVGLAGAVVSVAVSFGVNISREQQEAILALAAAIAAILFAADAHVRTHRGRSEAIRHVADQHAAAVRHAVDSHRAVAEAALAANQPPPHLVYPPPPDAA